jgi:hypothetical protein
MTYKMARSEWLLFFNTAFLVGQGVLMSGGHPRYDDGAFHIHSRWLVVSICEFDQMLHFVK